MEEKTNNEISGLTIVKTLLKVLAVVIVFSLGVILGRWQSKEWSVTNKHMSLQADGYHYCPYCGECLKQDNTTDWYITETTVICDER